VWKHLQPLKFQSIDRDVIFVSHVADNTQNLRLINCFVFDNTRKEAETILILNKW